MTDDDLLAGIDSKSLPLSAFTHTQHVRLAWCCLRRFPLLTAMAEFRRLLIAYATHHGKPNLYHETVTFAYLLLVHERMARTPDLTTWAAFSAEHTDLLSFRDGPFFRFYPREILQDSAARAHFALPTAAVGHAIPARARPALVANDQ
jgi:hypothetical protein